MLKNKGKAQKNKQKKEKQLYLAAYDLFTTKGINNTAIDDIVKKAGVAKGTFYLYFKDKYDIINKLVLKHSSRLIKEAIVEMNRKLLEKFEDKLLFFINYVIEYFERNKLMLKLINKNLSWGMYQRAIMNNKDTEELEEIYNFFIHNMKTNGMEEREAIITLFLIFELVGSVCYSSILYSEPTDMESLKPILDRKSVV